MTRLVEYLLELHKNEDRAALAALRRGLGKEPGAAGEMHPFVIPHLADSAPRSENALSWTWEQKCCFLVASFFASHPMNIEGSDRRTSNLGASVRKLQETLPEGALGPERRFVALLNAEREDLPDHLRSMIGLLKANDIGVDWKCLLPDLQAWGHPSRSVQSRWAKSFWSPAITRSTEDTDSKPEA